MITDDYFSDVEEGIFHLKIHLFVTFACAFTLKF